MASRIELEVSFVMDKNEHNVLEKIKECGFNLVDNNVEEDTYFTDKEEIYIKDKICLRTRKTNEDFLELTYKPKVDDNIEKYGKKEVNIALRAEDYLDIKYVIKGLGFVEYVSFKKKRATYTRLKDDIEYNIMLDEIENGGSFIELEILTDSEEEKEKLASKLDDFVIEMGCDKLQEKMKPYRDIVKEANIKWFKRYNK